MASAAIRPGYWGRAPPALKPFSMAIVSPSDFVGQLFEAWNRRRLFDAAQSGARCLTV
jgi:hypothetical protein